MDKRELYAYTGNPAQRYGVRRVTLQEGRPAGVNVIEAWTEGGLQADILPDTGLDLGVLRYHGVNMSFISKNGYDSPAAFIPYEDNFNNTFPGGMMYTCGLRSVGKAGRDGGEWHPLHGRFHGLQASEVCAEVRGGVLTISGILRETALFGHSLELRRVITIPVEGSTVVITDTLENLTAKPEEFMLLYHFNFGYPLLSEHAKLILPEGTNATPRDTAAAAGLASARIFTRPADNAEEQVFFYEAPETWVKLVNPALGIAAALRWSGDSLPVLTQWKSMLSGDYVLGLEPTNCYVMGRAAERENGTLKTIGGFETVRTRLELSFERDAPC
ncbi:MAG: aldose 1-epimerase family protein [Oscillospiraceae bacterium]|jgi:hypothetical protein|nr:aldose 1-epimerase family protein [Oscillospiraceae bacterium]